jgi:protein O-mannosyl-transferase
VLFPIENQSFAKMITRNISVQLLRKPFFTKLNFRFALFLAKFYQAKHMGNNKKSKVKLNTAKTSPSPELKLEPTANRWQALALFFICFIAYANTLGHDFVLDDIIVVTENAFVKKGVAGLPDIFSHDTFEGFFQNTPGVDVEGGRYRPFTLAMFVVERAIFGPKAFWGHLFNVVWYGLCVLSLFWMLRDLLRTRLIESHSVWLAFACTSFFAVHPLHTEVVANIKGRDEIMAMLGSTMACWLAWRAWKEKRPGLEALAALCFAVGMFSKENAITFLAVIPLAFFFFSDLPLQQIARRTLPFVAVAVLFILVRMLVLPGGLGKVSSTELMHNPYLHFVNGQFTPFSLTERLATVIYTLGKYLWLMILPAVLTHDYYPYHISAKSFLDTRVWLSTLLYLGMVFYALLSLRSKSLAGFGIWLYLTTLSIVSNLFIILGVHMSERFLFMPSAGLILFGLALVYRFWGDQSLEAIFPRTIWLVIGVVGVLFLARTIIRNPAWKDSHTLHKTDLKTSKESVRIQAGMGAILTTDAMKVKQSDPVRYQDLLRESEKYFLESIRLHPGHRYGHLSLGINYIDQGRFTEAIISLEKALALAPDGDFDTSEKLTLARKLLAEQQGSNGNFSSLEAAWRKNPSDVLLREQLANAYRAFAKTLGKKGQTQEALAYLQKSADLKTGDYETLRLFGILYSGLGKQQESLLYFERAVQVAPDFAPAWFELSIAFGALGNQAKQQEMLAKAQALDPNVSNTYGK